MPTMNTRFRNSTYASIHNGFGLGA